MNQAVKEFLTKAAEDEGLQARMQAATDPDEAYAIASSVQGGFTKEEFVEEMDRLRNAFADDEELGEDDLKALAGGLSDSDGALIAGTVTSGVIGICGFAVIAMG